MNKERFEKIKENVYTRCSIATHTGIGLTHCDKEELELIDEISRLNNIIDELEKEIIETKDCYEKTDDFIDSDNMVYACNLLLDKLNELKSGAK